MRPQPLTAVRPRLRARRKLAALVAALRSAIRLRRLTPVDDLPPHIRRDIGLPPEVHRPTHAPPRVF